MSVHAASTGRTPGLERERDRFLLAYYFVQRFSDVSAIRRENLFQKNSKYYLRYRSQKANIEATGRPSPPPCAFWKSTTTTRASPLTNMRLEGASLKTIAGLGGWTGLSNLQLYLQASGFERSGMAEGMAFFK